ncbi:MAG TPA: M1 family metallopeptidase [Candidatus Saccharimonadia bacterium]|nr:M1 family metallopeptidase [Candidatus Saccharimonadia bacterium]
MGSKVARLFEQFQPEHYELDLVPDREAMTFRGTVTVRGKKAGRPSQRLTFHQKELKIISAEITKHDKKGDQPIKISRINSQDSLDEVRLHSKEMIYPGEYTVTMEFEGQITRPMNGIYPCFFKHDGQDKQLIATQFESHHAREAFPCIDEPEAKATFDLTLTTPAGETVVANTPVKSQKKSGKSLVTTFATTPRMSCYLLAFVYGEMGFKESKTQDGKLVRAYATPDNVRLLEHGLDVAVTGLEFFEEYFGVPYPLPKLDIVALPDFSVGAMENWGLITFRETAMLADPKHSSIESKQIVALVVAHELSHQWFGNLVTMKWWNDLWLNESFANLMEYRAVDALYPEWRIWETFVANETGSAKRRDSLADVQSIKTEVNHPDEIGSLFDPSIVYAKGGTVLHMLMRYTGEEAFRRGLKVYFDKHRYGNTEAADLWEALGQASGEDISGFMADWVERPGYPLVDIDWQPGKPELKLSQKRFLNDPSAKASSDKPWQVPLAATLPLEPHVLVKSAATAKVAKGSSDGPLLFNHDGASYFLPRYAQAGHLDQIVKGIATGKVSNIDRLLLLDNYTMLQRGGIASTTELLDLLKGYKKETSESVWGSIAVAIAEARKLLERDESTEEILNQMVRELVEGMVDELGWDDKPDDSAQTLHLRGLVMAMAASAKSQKVIDEGLKRFAAFKKPSDLSPSTRTTVYFMGVRHGSDTDFKKILDMHNTIQNADEKDELASSLTSAKDEKRNQQLIELLKTDHIRRQDLIHWFVWLLRNRYCRQAAWQWLLDNWGWIEQEFGSDKRYSDFARYPGSIFSWPDEFKQYEKLLKPKKSVVAMTRDITLAEQEMSARLAWRERNEAAVTDWFKKRPQ